MNETRNLLLALLLSALVIMSWQYFFEAPRLKNLKDVAQTTQAFHSGISSTPDLVTENILKDRKEALLENSRISIRNTNINGSISLKGARLDDLLLNNYHEDLSDGSERVKLFSPAKSKEAYFSEFGWLSDDSSLELPGNDSLWKSDSAALTPNKPVNLSWHNSQGIEFTLKFELDEEYMLSVTQMIKNSTSSPLNYRVYGRINRVYPDLSQSFAILHEGGIGVLNDQLYEIRYKDLKKEGAKHFPTIRDGSWLGITDKYWLTSIIPVNLSFDTNFIYNKNSTYPRYQVDFVSSKLQLLPGETKLHKSLLFAGPKKLELLDNYSAKYNIKLFDRAVDFGWFYFLTKPMFYALQLLYSVSGNFGIAILLLTVIVKLLMFPLANKSYQSMSKMKLLQPRAAQLKELYGNDKLKLNQEIMALYKKENINPLSGCLPLIVQIPVFFSLYKVLFVTIEMRHAKFFGWIKDLSMPDPTSILNLFGLLPWNTPEFLSIGIWPLIMGITMFFQQKLNPEPADPLQAKFMKFLPVLFTFMFYTFPAGLIIYWAWNNTLSILQQWYLMKKVEGNGKKA
jgi:YidC/Oxa1 family membrane protein insertase